MNTISSKSNEAKNLPLQIKAKATGADSKKSTATTLEIMDSPRGFSASAKAARKVTAKTIEPATDTLTTKASKTHKRRPVSVSATLRAQMLAGKNDSAEMYRGAMSPPSPNRSVSPKAQPMPARVRLSALSTKEAAELSDDAFDALSLSSDDEASLNTGWNELGIDSDSEGEASKAKPSQRAHAKHVDEAGATSDSDSDFLDRWNEWGMSDDE